MIVTSTNTIEGREVLRYFDPISATAVIGANALSEIRGQLRSVCFADPFGIFRWAIMLVILLILVYIIPSILSTKSRIWKISSKY
ncbi:MULTISPECIES: heavy metal-binding domain-containing protein [Sphingobacterium]|uniref:heavy metal-binding domain-containing protein n=1 Tax=Sphingobacterium TaxID=28453 RepID=UPI0010507D27|nr:MULTISPECIES: heavy metal-binding domain-containing protein [Sphingobacterium]MCW2259637.1 hypothetical protein [Sphingobacterium kitahiroshimense]